MLSRTVCIGYDPREQAAYAVARRSIAKRGFSGEVYPIVLEAMVQNGLYRRTTEERDGKLYDAISEATMSTEFAISRFLAPEITRRSFGRKVGNCGWVLFMDCDVLVRKSIDQLFDYIEKQNDKAVFCVKHDYKPKSSVKMDGQEQTKYNCKNWSSVMAINVDHPANRALTIDLINEVPGRDLHRFCWLEHELIGGLDIKWNWLANYSSIDTDPAIVHFTEGGPWLEEYRQVPYAKEWMNSLLTI